MEKYFFKQKEFATYNYLIFLIKLSKKSYINYKNGDTSLMHTSHKILILVLLLIFPFEMHGSDFINGIKSFDQMIYGGARQNWCIDVKADGTLYFANHKGLLEFDGTNWNLHNLPDETIIRSVCVDGDSVIYTSGYMELGYWKTDDYGNLNYHSLSEKANNFLINNIEFWNIATSKDYVYFHSFTNVLAYHNDSIIPVNFPRFTSVMNKVNGKILVAVRSTGIYEIIGENAIPYITGDFFNDKLIKFIIPFKTDQLLIGTAAHGIFKWDGQNLSLWNNEWTRYFIENEPNRGKSTKSGKIIIGTIVDGAVIFDSDGNLLSKINTENGLLNNTVLGVGTDPWENIWFALDNGINFIPESKPQGFTTEEITGTGAIYATEIYNGKQYLGTNQGLFVKPLKENDNSLTLVPETQGQIWDLRIIDDKLWVGHNQGTFVIDNERVSQISDQSGGFSIRQDPLNENYLLQCTYSNIVVYNKIGNNYEFKNRINGFVDLIRYLEIDHKGNIWASHMHRGIYKVTTDDNRENVTNLRYFGKDVFGKDNSIHVFKIENRIVFTANNRLFTYDDLNDLIVPFGTLNEQIGKFASAHRILEAPNHHYWFITAKEIGLFSINQDSATLIKEYPISLFSSHFLVENFENILPIDDSTAILCLQNGVAFLDASVNESFNQIDEYQPIPRQIELYNNRGKNELLSLKTKNLKIKHNFHNIFFRFSFPLINELPVSYQFFLKGLNVNWSEKTNNPEFRFERLPKGNYELQVKATDLWDNESKTYNYSFEIKPPWYSSGLAILVYVILLIATLLLFRRWGIQQTRKKERLEHEKREKELIRLRNEKLRNEVKHKSKELANSTMSIIKKNEFLLNLKSIVNKQKIELGSRYPDKYFDYLNRKIDENISNQDDWQIFETNFERAHEQFLQKIKEQYTELTPGDLRLCAYLRMNLSSKEIAPLLGISVRGVENHRYRLRKKFNLKPDESLTNKILSI